MRSKHLDELSATTAERIKARCALAGGQGSGRRGAKRSPRTRTRKRRSPKPTSAAKGKPYENDPLFMYLWTKKHGQAEDRSGAFVRFFDRKVARLVGYSDARANYAMLQEIPARLREHAKNKQADVEAAKRKRCRDRARRAGCRRRRADRSAGRRPRAAAMKAAEEAVVKITAELQRSKPSGRRRSRRRREAVYGRAVDLLAAALAREDLRQLYQRGRRARATKADDQAISSIRRRACVTAEGRRRDRAQIRADIREMAQRRTELEGARDRARRVGYDDPRGTFGGRRRRSSDR